MLSFNPSNACKFSSKEDIVLRASAKKISAENSIPKYELEFSVEDHGIGITEEAKNKILSPFVQADNSITRKFV